MYNTYIRKFDIGDTVIGYLFWEPYIKSFVYRINTGVYAGDHAKGKGGKRYVEIMMKYKDGGNRFAMEERCSLVRMVLTEKTREWDI